MKNKLLLPRYCRIAGLIMLPLFITLFIAVYNYNFLFPFLATHMHQPEGLGGFLNGNNNLSDEVALSGVIISLFMIAFSRLKIEDEYTSAIRLRSLQIGIYVNYALVILLTFGLYNGDFLAVLFYNMVTILIIFILVLNYNLYIKPRFSKLAAI